MCLRNVCIVKKTVEQLLSINTDFFVFKFDYSGCMCFQVIVALIDGE